MTEEELQHRIKSALALLSEGSSLKVGDLTFGSNDKTHFSVSGWTRSTRLQSLTKQSALAELKDIKLLFSKMIDASQELADFIHGRQVEYSLGYDYGMGALRICSEYEGQIKWETELQG
jgi:hypothetical protein